MDPLDTLAKIAPMAAAVASALAAGLAASGARLSQAQRAPIAGLQLVDTVDVPEVPGRSDLGGISCYMEMRRIRMADQEGEEAREVRIEYGDAEGIPTYYATNLVVQHTPAEFILLFYEAYPPVLVGTPDERKARLNKIETVPAKCLARVIVAASRMPDFVQVFQDNLKTYLSKMAAREGQQ